MFAEEIRRAIPATPRGRLAELSAAVWKGYACGAVTEDEAQALAEEIAARKAIPPKPAEPRRRVGSRPRSPEAMERRRRWTGSGWLPPQLAARFTMAETAVLSTIAAEVARRGLCRLTIGHVAALAGVCKATVRAAVRQAQALGFITSEEWRITAWRNAPNTVRIVSAEWRTWLRMRDRKRAGADHPRQAEGSRHGGENLDAPHRGARLALTRHGGAPTARGGGSKSSDPLRITDSFSCDTINHRSSRQKKAGKGGGDRWRI